MNADKLNGALEGLLPCPLCGGKARVEIKQGSWGYYPESAWAECMKCGVKTRSYNDDEKTKDGHKILAADKWNQRPPAAGLAELTSDWLPVSEPPKTNSICIVYWRDEEGDRFDFEYYEDDCWNNHSSNYDHYMAVGGSQAGGPDCICTGPSEAAPYTHWKYVAPPSEAAAREFLGKVE